MKRTEIAQLLPAVFQRTLRKDNPLPALLEVMEAHHAPAEALLDQLDAIFDPRRTMDKFVPFLAYWADLTRLFERTSLAEYQSAISSSPIETGLGPLRELVASAAYLSQWRGTREGLLLFLQTATGLEDFEIEENVGLNGQPRPFHIIVRAPPESSQYSRLIERIVELEKPAYVTHEFVFGPAAGK